MSEQHFEPDPVDELREMAAAAENPRTVSCCYVVRIDIWDRAVLDNAWAGGHGGAGWDAIEIGL
jgi:hypothetical protein